MIRNRVDIAMRPAIVNKKIRIGDLEGDTIVGIRTAGVVEQAMNNIYNNSLVPFKTITYDNGTEFANHENISNELGCAIILQGHTVLMKSY